MRRFALLAGLLWLALAGSAAAEIYKWVDDNGRVHYGDRPGRADAASLQPRDSARGLGMSPEQAAAQDKLLHVRKQERAAERAAQAEAVVARAERSRNCEAARRQAQAMRGARYLYEPLADGGRRVYSEEQRRAAEAAADDLVTHWCAAD